MTISSWIREKDGSIIIDVLVSPKAQKNQIVGIHDNRLKVKVAAPPVDGKANAELISFLAEVIGIRTYQIEIESGHTNKKKTLKLTEVTKETVESIIKETP